MGDRSGQLPPVALVIFGASGDLARRKLVPALWQTFRRGRLPREFVILGYARTEKSDEEFRREMREAGAASGGAAR